MLKFDICDPYIRTEDLTGTRACLWKTTYTQMHAGALLRRGVYYPYLIAESLYIFDQEAVACMDATRVCVGPLTLRNLAHCRGALVSPEQASDVVDLIPISQNNTAEPGRH